MKNDSEYIPEYFLREVLLDLVTLTKKKAAYHKQKNWQKIFFNAYKKYTWQSNVCLEKHICHFYLDPTPPQRLNRLMNTIARRIHNTNNAAESELTKRAALSHGDHPLSRRHQILSIGHKVLDPLRRQGLRLHVMAIIEGALLNHLIDTALHEDQLLVRSIPHARLHRHPFGLRAERPLFMASIVIAQLIVACLCHKWKG